MKLIQVFFILFFLILPLNQIKAQSVELTNHYKSINCGFEFDYPSKWEVVEDASSMQWYKCALNIGPSNWNEIIANSEMSLTDYALSIISDSASFKKKLLLVLFFMMMETGSYPEDKV